MSALITAVVIFLTETSGEFRQVLLYTSQLILRNCRGMARADAAIERNVMNVPHKRTHWLHVKELEITADNFPGDSQVDKILFKCKNSSLPGNKIGCSPL